MRAPGTVLAAVCALALAAVTAPAATAQPAPAPPRPGTKLLVIGTRTPQATPDALAPVMPLEVQATLRLYLAGTLEQWFVKQDRSGVVFILNVPDPAQGRALLDGLPLVRAGLMEFQIIPIGPLAPLEMLLTK